MKNSENNDLPMGKGNLNKANALGKDGKARHVDAPDYFGRIKLKIGEVKISAWGKKAADTGKIYLSLQVDEASDSAETVEARREVIKKDYLKEKKQNKDEFILMDRTGTMHQSQPDAREDMFGTILIDGEKTNFKAFATKSKAGNRYLRLEVSDGLESKEDRFEETSKFLN